MRNMKSSMYKLSGVLLLVVVGCVVGIVGCGDAHHDHEDAGAEDDGGHSHAEGPHGGEVVVVGEHVAHLEVLHDHAGGTLCFYVTSEDMKEQLALDEPPQVNLKTADGPLQLVAAAIEGAEGEAQGYQAQDTVLEAECLGGQVVLVLKGKQYFVDLPHGDDHAHETGEDHDEGHEDDHDDQDHETGEDHEDGHDDH